jgi:hypothetical protein
VTSSLSAVRVFFLCCSIPVLPVHPRTRSKIAASTNCKHKWLCQGLETVEWELWPPKKFELYFESRFTEEYRFDIRRHPLYNG